MTPALESRGRFFQPSNSFVSYPFHLNRDFIAGCTNLLPLDTVCLVTDSKTE